MKTFLNQKGSGHLVIFLGLAVIVAVAFVGVRVMHNNEANPAANSSASKSVTAPTTIKTQADLVKAQQSLDQTSIDSNVNPDQLNNDLNSLL